MDFPDRSELLYHKPVWGANPFLLCRTVTPLDFRDLRLVCNCCDCYISRIRTASDFLTHPFGSRCDPPRGRYELAQVLRSRLDTDRDVFATDNSIVLLNMLQTDPSVATLGLVVPVMSLSMIRSGVQDLLVSDPGNRSLNGLFYDRLKFFDLRRKGPRLLRRARRSHSIAPDPFLYDHPEIVDTWSAHESVFRDPHFEYPDFVAKFPSSIERLVHDRHFHDRRELNFKFSSSSNMSNSPHPRVKKRSRSLVSAFLV